MSPSTFHEGLVQMVRDGPQLVAELLDGLFDLPVPKVAEARLEPEDLSQWKPTECRADAVVTLRDDHGTALLGVVVEVQHSRDPNKRFTWHLYVAALRARLRCGVVLVVIACNPQTAAWCARPIPLGHPGMTLTPLVAGPDVIPVLTDPDRARAHPWLAVLSALAHHNHPDSAAVLDAFIESLEPLNPERGALYIDIVRAGFPQPARQNLEDLMSTGRYEFQSDYARHYIGLGREQGETLGKALGVAEGEANAIVTVLVTRGLKVTKAVRKQITDCADPRQLTAWLKRAVTVTKAEDIFAERSEPRP